MCKEMRATKLHRNSIPRNLYEEKDIRQFVSALMSNSEEFRAMKLVVLGNGKIGKTTLLRALKEVINPDSNQVRRLKESFY